MLEAVRRTELEAVRPWFEPGTRVLELGAGNGYQASVLASWGCEVVALDVAAPVGPAYFAVQQYDGQHLPFEDCSFDRVFTSNVLEHIHPLGPLLDETRRVLRHQGFAVHVLPSPAWRFWTSLAHYAYILLYATAQLRGRQEPHTGLPPPPPASVIARDRGKIHLLKRLFIPGAHGVYPSALSELYFYSRLRWRSLFDQHGFLIERESGAGVFYAGYGVIPRLTLSRRRQLAAVLGSACNVFVLRRRRD